MIHCMCLIRGGVAPRRTAPNFMRLIRGESTPGRTPEKSGVAPKVTSTSVFVSVSVLFLDFFFK